MTNAILPHQLPQALDLAPAGCEILSLDCFDTLLWRHGHAPRDVFADIGAAGGSIDQRRWAESHARSRAALKRNSNEVSIAGIYEMLLPNASEVERAAAVAAELDAEARHCFGFGPTIALMREAKRRGLRVMIVSDTYLGQDQLRSLVAAAAGDDVAALVDMIFCSSEHGVSKAEGLFRHVLKKTGARPGTILHIGDNPGADLQAPSQLGIPALHLLQFTEATQQRLRLEAAVGSLLNGASGRLPNWQPHRAQLACSEPVLSDPAVALGHSVLGPVLTAFDDWLRAEAEALRAGSAGRVHMVFLMRDGHLPLDVFRARGAVEGVTAAPVEISRFTAAASSFTGRKAIDHYLEREAGVGDLESMARQLLFDARETRALIVGAQRDKGTTATFLSSVARPTNIKKIVERSAAFAERLVRHVRNAVDPRPGDTLMLVDLGYHGSVQNRVEPLLRKELAVEVAGRYLLLREQDISGFDKRGLFDQRNYDLRALNALTGNVTVVEQLCTIAQGSVIDYASKGDPVCSVNGVKARQSQVRERVQQGCLHFAAEHGQGVHRAPVSDCSDTRRHAAAATLGRFLFMPMPQEIEVLAAFEHDVNLGGGETVPLFDLALAERQLREEGMFYLKNAERMYLPAELRGQGLALSLSLLCQRRFGLDFRMSDFREPGIRLPVIIADGREVSVSSVEASRTHDGFFTAAIPVGRFQYAIGLQFGRLFDWVEIQSASFRPVAAIKDEDVRRHAEVIAANPSFEGMEAMSSELMRCTDPAGFMMVPPPGSAAAEPMVLNVVFRPIGSRSRPQASAADAPESAAAGAAA